MPRSHWIALSQLVVVTRSPRWLSGHLRPLVAGDRPAVQLGGADLPRHVGRYLPVMIRAERAWQFDLHGLRRGERGIQARQGMWLDHRRRTHTSICTRTCTDFSPADPPGHA